MTSAKTSEGRAKGLRYYCDENYSPEHYLKHKKTQLFMFFFYEMLNLLIEERMVIYKLVTPRPPTANGPPTPTLSARGPHPVPAVGLLIFPRTEIIVY